jgi:hypothetical protein
MEDLPEPVAQLKVHVDFNNLRRKLGHAVDRSIRLISIGFRSAHQPIEEELRMPGNVFSSYFSDLQVWSDGEAREHYSDWLFATGLRDVLEAFGAFLDECYEIGSFLHLIKKEKQNGILLVEDYDARNESLQKYRRLGIGKKLKKLKPWFDMLSSDQQESIRSMVSARNILVHHQGIVPEEYARSGTFQIKWMRLALMIFGPDERELKIGTIIKAGESYGLRTNWEQRDFSKGDRLHLEPLDFSGICWTVFFASESIREALEKDWAVWCDSPGSDF